jgi:hypothetical protein
MREQAIDDPFTAAPIKSRTCGRKPSGAIDIGEKVGLERISRSCSLKGSCPRVIFDGRSIHNRCCHTGEPQCSSINAPSLHLVTSPPRLRNHSLQLIDLSLRTSECSELRRNVSAKPDLDIRSPTVNFDTAQRAPLDRGL